MVVLPMIVMLGAFISSFWFPMQVSILYLIVVFFFELYLLYMCFVLNEKAKVSLLKSLVFSKLEAEVYRRYFMYFNYPFAAMQYSAVLVVIQFSAFLFVPLFIIKGLYIAGIFLAINYFIVGQITVRLNPHPYLKDSVDDGDDFFLDEKKAIESVLEKLKSLDEIKRTNRLYEKIKITFLHNKSVTASDLQRKFHIEYAKAHDLLSKVKTEES